MVGAVGFRMVIYIYDADRFEMDGLCMDRFLSIYQIVKIQRSM
jgi:hypothetical protein